MLDFRFNKPEMLALESRIMFDGAFAGDAASVSESNELINKEAEREYQVRTLSNPNQIIFLDNNVKVSSSFGSHLDAETELVFLESKSSGIQQITDHLADRQGIESIHIISHGSEGQINIGNTVLNNDNLSSYNDQLSRIGGALAEGGDILLYGCNVGEATGRDFVAAFADATGADVAASKNVTGGIDVGGDWRLEIESGSIEADTTTFSQFSGFSGTLTTPSVSSGGSTGYIKDTDAIIAASSISISNGGDYGGGGSLNVAITSADSSETLSLTKVSNAATGANVVSVVGSSLYLGSGSTANVIGSIDGTLNGENGTALQINFISNSFSNPSFETGDLTGWTADTSTQIDIGTTSIAGIRTPVDGSDPANSGGDSDVPSTKGTWTAPVNTVDKSHGTYSLQLKSAGMTTSNGYDVVHGPSVYSDVFAGENGQTISFDWRALGGGDAYDVFGYIVNTSTNATTEILNATGTSAAGTTAWATANVTIPATGNYRFVFISGTYDFTGGRAAGASLYIDNIQVFNAVTDAIVSSVAKLVTYETAETTMSAEERAERTLTFTATDADGNAGNSTATVYETFPVEITNPQQVSAVNTVSEVSVEAGVIKINRDGLQTFVRETTVERDNQSSNSLKLFDADTLSGESDVGSTFSEVEVSVREASPSNNTGPTAQSNTAQASSPNNPDQNFATPLVPTFNNLTLKDGGLSVLNGIKDPDISSLGRVSFTIPNDAFAKSNNDTMVTLKAAQAGGRELPSWLKFDPVEGKFEGQLPEDFVGSLKVLVTATDQNGNEVTTTFIIEKDANSGPVNDEASELIPVDDAEAQILAARERAFASLEFSQQLQLSKLTTKPLSQIEIREVIRAMEVAG